MGKFYKKFYQTQIPEWRTHYVDYKTLRHQISVIKGAVLHLARAYVGIKSRSQIVATTHLFI